jgi:hypothetical protein
MTRRLLVLLVLPLVLAVPSPVAAARPVRHSPVIFWVGR